MSELLVKQEVGAISYDFETAKQKIAERLEEFKGATFSEESKPIAKKVVADLRKEQKAFADRVKEVKKIHMKPFDDFKQQADELIKLYDEPISFINGQVQAYEEQRRERKKAEIMEIYNSVFISNKSVPLEKIYNPEWENATYKKPAIEQEIKDWFNKIVSDLETISGMESPDELEAISLYKKTLDVTDAIRLINDRAKIRQDEARRQEEEQKRREEERIRQQERERVEAERRLQQAEEEKQQAVEQAKEDAVEVLVPEQGGKADFYEYAITLTESEKEKLEMYMDSVGITYLCKGVL